MKRFANAPVASLDFETRSACNLKTHGTWKYSCDPSTQILCLAFRLPHWPEGDVSIWHPAFPNLGIDETGEPDRLAELFQWIAEGGLIEAHNSFFEYCIWMNIQTPQYGWPEIPFAQWRCSAAKCAAHALPRKLEDAARALKLKVQKDVDGAKVMMKMTKPRKSRKAERVAWAKVGVKAPRRLWHESRELLDRLLLYCAYDVLTEEAISQSLPDLSPDEQRMFQMDLELNVTGFQIDREAVTAALTLIHRESVILNQELSGITDGKVRKATQRAKMLAWFDSQHFPLPDTRKETIDGLLESPHHSMPWKVKRALEVIRTLGRSSTAKYRAMKNWMARDGRVRGGMLYHGATTGRWSGKGVQPHNFPKGGLFTPEGKPLKLSMDELWRLIKAGHRPDIRKKVRNVMEALATALRGAITAGAGKQLYVADYASIEARVLLWVAGDEDAHQVFRDHRDIYCEMASSIYGYPCSKETLTERSMGKIAILGLGYQMGVSKFVDTCAKFGIVIDDDFSQTVVDAYRTKFWRVKQLWKDQEQAAMRAVKTRRSVRCGKVLWLLEGTFLYCQLPSGRRLCYPFPLVQRKETPWGVTEGLTFMGVDAYTHKWKRQTTYGGMIVENIVQAIARDLMAYAMVRAAEDGTYQVILSVHDELVAEALQGVGSVGEFESLMAECPDWADGCPVEAEGWVGYRYKK